MLHQLKLAGFTEIKRCEFGDSTDPMFAQVEDRGRFIDENLHLRELAIEARKPNMPGKQRESH